MPPSLLSRSFTEHVQIRLQRSLQFIERIPDAGADERTSGRDELTLAPPSVNLTFRIGNADPKSEIHR